MAAKRFLLRCKTSDGQHTIDSLSDESSLADLKFCLQKFTGVSPDSVKIMIGFPPRPLNVDDNDLKLNDVGIHSGDSIVIGQYKLGEVKQSKIQKSTSVVSKERSSKRNHGAVKFPSSSGNVQFAAEMSHTAGPGGDQKEPLPIGGAESSSAARSVEEADNANEVPPGIVIRHVVPANNSCLFTSIYFIVSGGDSDLISSKALRQIIAETVAADPVKFNHGFLGMTNSQYCNWITNEDHWGGAIEIAIMSDYYGLEIVAVDTQSLKFHHFGENHSYDHRIYLIYDGIHYDPLVMEPIGGGKCVQTFFSVTDKRSEEMVFEIAREANSSRQFTDIRNFKLKCLICNKFLRGNVEASQHAKETMHLEFGEV